MADEDVRRAERRWRAEGTPEAEAAYLRAQYREGRIRTVPELEGQHVSLAGTFKLTQKTVTAQLKGCGVAVVPWGPNSTMLVLGARGGGQRPRREARERKLPILAEVKLIELLDRHEALFGGAGVPLCRAAADGDLPALVALIEGGANLDWVDASGLGGQQGATALWYAVHRRRPAAIAALVQAGADPCAHRPLRRESISLPGKQRDRERAGSVLHFAAAHDNAEALRALVGAGLAVDSLDAFGDTPLQVAAQQGALAALSALLELGADANASGTRERCPLQLTREPEAVRALLAAGAEPRLYPGQPLEVARDLLAAGADPNLVQQGRSPLMLAANAGDVARAELLLAHGADPEGTGADLTRRTPPLIAAARTGDAHFVRLLLDAGATQHLGQALAEVCCDRGSRAGLPSLAVAELLLTRGAPADVVGQWSRRPALILAAREGWQAGVALLLAHGAPVDARDTMGKTALLHAAQTGQLPILEALIAAGADPSLTDASGRSARELTRHRAVLAYLERASSPDTGTGNRPPGCTPRP